MRFNSFIEYFTPKEKKRVDESATSVEEWVSLPPLAASGANNVYIVNKDCIIRIIPAADMYVKFSDKKDTVIADATNGILLKANQEYFMSSGPWSFMSASASTGSVTLVEDKG